MVIDDYDTFEPSHFYSWYNKFNYTLQNDTILLYIAMYTHTNNNSNS